MQKIKCPYKCKNNGNITCDNCPRWISMEYLIKTAHIPYSEKILEKYKPKYEEELIAIKEFSMIKNNITDFVENGENLYISSNNKQTGKTTRSIKLMLKYFDSVWANKDYIMRGYFISVPALSAQAKSYKFISSDDYTEIKYAVENSDIIIWDALTDLRLTNDVQGVINTLITYRLQMGKANIFNGVEPNDLVDFVGEDINEILDISKKIELLKVEE